MTQIFAPAKDLVT